MIAPEPFSPGPATAVLALQAGVPSWVDVLSRVAIVFVALALVVVSVVLILVALRLHGMLKQVMQRFQGEVGPILKHATSVADNVDYVSSAVRHDVQLLQKTVASANQRVNRVAAAAEQRVNELNALLQVVQEEAEELFIGTAARLRGARASADALRRLREEPYGQLEEEYDDDFAGPDEPESGLETHAGRR